MFVDVNVLGSVLEVDCYDLLVMFGVNVSWDIIMFEVMDEFIMKDINNKLFWLCNYFEKNFRLDGLVYGLKNELVNILSWLDFE